VTSSIDDRSRNHYRGSLRKTTSLNERAFVYWVQARATAPPTEEARGLPLVIEACEYERLHAVLAYEFERITTHVRLVGAGVDGLGKDVSVFREDGTALHETRPAPNDVAPSLLQRGSPFGRPAGQPADTAARGHRFPLDGVDEHHHSCRGPRACLSTIDD
jgi:hypothetical protein